MDPVKLSCSHKVLFGSRQEAQGGDWVWEGDLVSRSSLLTSQIIVILYEGICLATGMAAAHLLCTQHIKVCPGQNTPSASYSSGTVV